MFSLMLDLKSKTLCLVSTLIGYEEGKAIVEKYDRIFLFPMFFKCHYHLHPLVKFERGIVN
jgi:putative effector of murein hydrolase